MSFARFRRTGHNSRQPSDSARGSGGAGERLRELIAQGRDLVSLAGAARRGWDVSVGLKLYREGACVSLVQGPGGLWMALALTPGGSFVTEVGSDMETVMHELLDKHAHELIAVNLPLWEALKRAERWLDAWVAGLPTREPCTCEPIAGSPPRRRRETGSP